MDAIKTNRLVQAVQELSMARSLERVMEIVRTVARELTGADGATFVLRDQENCFYADEDAISPLWKGKRFPISTCISGWSMLNKKSVVIEDIYQDDRIPHAAYKPTFVKSLAMVPIRRMDPIGAIGNYWATHHLPTNEEVSMLQSLADITAVNIENVNVYLELEKRVRDRTAELEDAHTKLKDAYKELETFSYSVSHDLRAPLRSIIGYANALQEDHSDELGQDASRLLQTISSNASRLNLLIEHLLRFSRVAQQGLELVEVDQTKMVERVVNGLDRHQARITVHPLSNVKADPTLLYQVWHNLISNAIKYSSKKPEPMVEIGCRQEDSEIVYYVKDNGAGFDMTYAEKLFGVFQRLHRSVDFEGTGIGLALVKRIISRHGGHVWAKGKIDEGASFYFSLPETQ